MIRGACAALALAAGPLAAQDLPGQSLCQTVWDRLVALTAPVLVLTGDVTPSAMEGCLFTRVRADAPGPYVPDWHLEALHLTGDLPVLGEGAMPERLVVRVSDLRPVFETGNPRVDYILAVQARVQSIQGDLDLAWDRAARELRLARLDIDFPGENRVTVTARATGVDLSGAGAAQMSLASAALVEADLMVRTHGLFEAYLLNLVADRLLPEDGDMEAAMAAVVAEASAAVLTLPEATFPGDSRAALVALLGELPNPAGTLAVTFRAEPGFGAARFAGFAVTGLPDTVAAAAPVLDGVTVRIEWTHEESP